MARESLNSLGRARIILGSPCEKCEEKKSSFRGVYNRVTYSYGRVTFHCSNETDSKNKNHSVTYKLGFKMTDEDFMELERSFRKASSIDGYLERGYSLDNLRKTLEAYAIFADRGFEYELFFRDENGIVTSALVNGKKVEYRSNLEIGVLV